MRCTRSASRRAIAVLAIVLAGVAVPAAADFVTFGNGYSSKWDDPVHGTPATVTWGFMPDGTTVDPSIFIAAEVTGGSNITQLRDDFDASYGTGAFDAALDRAFDTWERAAGISFVGPVADPGLPVGSTGATTPDIRIGAFAPVPLTGFAFLGAVGFGPPGDDLHFPDPLAGDILFNLAQPFIMPDGEEDDPIVEIGNDLENLFLHELGHAAMGLGHPAAGPGEVMYVGAGCCDVINRVPSADDLEGARTVYGASAVPLCENGFDDDQDGSVDYPEDPGCKSGGNREDPQCQDGISNDGDALVDFDGGQSIHGACSGGVCPPGVSDPDANGVADPDPQCVGKPTHNAEKKPSCGLGPELALVLLPLLAVRPRRQRPRRS